MLEVDYPNKCVPQQQGVYWSLSEKKSVHQLFHSVFELKFELRLTEFVCGNEINLSNIQFSLKFENIFYVS